MQRFSKSQIVRAGKLIAGFHAEPTDELIEAFRTTHAWRNAHVDPMRRVRSQLTRHAKKFEAESVTAGRLKRLQSLRRKIKRGNVTLYQVQDIAGCRAIMPTQQGVDELAALYAGGGLPHEVVGAKDYIENPKSDGYRSRHIVLKFEGPDEITGGNRLTVEVQIRTRLQHAWATAVEAVGMVRNENLKAGQGSPEWLRLFELMAAEAAEEEGRSGVPTVPGTRQERRAELQQVARALDAVRHLEGYNEAIRHTEAWGTLKGTSYLIAYDLETKTVSVRPFSQFNRAAEQYFKQELFPETTNTVLVEVDRVDELRAAYPSYFLDVGMFTERLRRAVYEPAPKASRWGNFEWLKDYRRGQRNRSG